MVGQGAAGSADAFLPARRRGGGTCERDARARPSPGSARIFCKLYYNPDGHGRDGEWDFVSYFECADEHLPTFDQICQAPRDVRQNPEWRYVTEGPEWRGGRVPKW